MSLLAPGCERVETSRTGTETGRARVLMYDSETDPKSVWGVYARDGGSTVRVRFKTAAPNDPALIELSALSGSPMGLNLRLPALRGMVDFEYRVNSGGEGGGQFALYVIPIKTAMDDHTAPVEVGSDAPADARDATSAFRRRFVVPAAHADGQWHSGRLAFDFELLPEAEYSIIAPRINEGLPSNAPGSVTFRRIQVRAEFTPQFVAQATTRLAQISPQERSPVDKP